jgi:hypothetical protein
VRHFSFEHIKNSEFNTLRRKFSLIRDTAKTIRQQVEAVKNDLRSIQKSQETGETHLIPRNNASHDRVAIVAKTLP